MPTFKNIHSQVEKRVLLHPGRPAVLHGDTTLSYLELNEKANQLAHQLLEVKGVKGGYVGICLERGSDLMVAILAVLKAGAAYVPFDVEYPAERLQYMAEISRIPVMISTAGLGKRLPSGNYKIVDIQALSGNANRNNPGLDIPETQAAYVLFTSGSTGQPKGVQMPHEALLNLIDWQIRQTEVHDEGRTLQFAPVSFDVHFQEIFSTWCDGGCICLIGDEQRLNALALLDYLEKVRINRLYLPFIALQSLCELSKHSALTLPELKEIITAGEQLQVTPALSAFFSRIPHCKLYNHYGPTETHVVTSYLLAGPPSAWPTLPPIGKAIQHAEIYLLGENGRPVKDGEEGELFAAGRCLADGYLGREDLSAERFVPDPFHKDRRMYKTGDLARKLPDGNLEYLGRIDGQVKVRGYRIELGEIEVAVSRFGHVTRAAASVREDHAGQKKLVVYLVMEDGHTLNVKDIRRFLQTRLPDYMMPSAFVQLQELPRTPSGKIDRRALPAPATTRPELGIPYTAPVSVLEKTLCRLWSSLLGIEPVGTRDNFFDLGGNSLLALQSVALLKAEQGIDLSVIKVYQHPTVAALAASMEGKDLSAGQKENMKARAEARHRQRPSSAAESIAVIGMSLRFPGADTVEEFWNNLRNGVESITVFGPAELDPSLPAELVNDPNYVPARGIIRDAKGFDAAFFNMNPNVAKVTDPQQRVMLELAWNALEHAGYSPSRYEGLIGIFAGMGNSTYYLNNVLPDKNAVQRVGSFLAMTQNEKDYIATRVAYELNLKGLAVSVHTACSTSLTAIAQACDALWNRECDMVLAGGSAITAPVNSGQRYEEGAMYSNDGHTRTFDAGARGTVFSDGAGLVVLKRYEDALADGDTIYALVRGAALNNDGGDKGSFTAPSVEGQSSVISMAQAMAGVEASGISYVETHGTATPLGDPIEIEGLTKAFREHTAAKQFCALGSVKTNFGHLTAAAGVAGFIKTVLALYHREIPANLHFNTPNPQINFSDTPFFVNDRLRPWDTDLLPRRAGVSSFGVGGTNAHIILEEAPEALPSGAARSKHLLTLSAKTESALEARRRDLAVYLRLHPDVNMADLAYTLQNGRHDFPHRWFATAGDAGDALQQLENPDAKRSSKHQLTQEAEGIVFMFPGQGSQYVGMGRALYRDEIIFREAVDRCNSILEPLLGRDLRELLFAAEGDAAAEQLLKQTYYTQPALFTIGYSLAQLWMSWGIRPKALIGHSIGEFVAATVAGVFSLEDALTIVAGRSKLMQDCPGGAMLSVRLPEEKIIPQLTPQVAIAAVNGPQLCVVAGPYEEVEKLQKKWEAADIVCKALHTSHAFHSPMMEPVVKPFAEIVGKISLNKPKIPILSTVTTQWLKDEEATDPMYWAAHLRATVRFAEGVKALWQEKPRLLLLELGPRNTATTLARQQAIDPKAQKAVPSLGDTAESDAEWTSLLSAAGQLWLHGIRIDHQAFYALEKRRRIALPGYPFEHKDYWLDPPAPAGYAVTAPAGETDTTTQNIPTLENSSAMPPRKERMIREITEILEEASGMELEGADRAAGFVELGLDSLFLTQVALTLSKKYGTKITFRQLNEDLSSLDSLSEYLDRQLPAEAAPAPVKAVLPSQPSAGHPGAAALNNHPSFPSLAPQQADGSLQWLITQQLQVMQQQLQMMSGQTPAMPAALPAATTPKATPPDQSVFVSPDEEKELKKPFGAVARIEKQLNSQFTEAQQQWLREFTHSYNERTKSSKAYTQQHRAHLADPRVVTGFRPHLKEMIYQPVVNRSLGSRIWDIDGNEYVDILNGFGSNMFGHNPPFIVSALSEQLQKGYELGPQHELAGEVAAMICEMTQFDRAGFCNTGSEAVLGAMRIARTVTGRSLIVSFNGSYHGINDEVILRGTKKFKSIPAAAGILPEAVQNMLVLDYGTPESLEIIRRRAHEIAAVMVEPVQSRRADFHPKEFLQELRQITTAGGALLIFDEVITGFRVLPGGAQQYFDVKADVGTYGKVVGGGMPIGVIAGKKEYMDALDGGFWQYGDQSVPEAGVTYFAGTFVRHPFALAAAKAALLHMKEKGQELQESLNANTAWLAKEINGFCDKLKTPFHLVHFGSLFKPKYDTDLQHADLIYLLLRHKGIHVYDGFPCFLTEAHSREDIEHIARMFRETIFELVDKGFLPGTVSEVRVNGASVKTNPSHAAHAYDPSTPPVPGAMLGKNPDGTPGWFVPDPSRPGKYLKLNLN
ncbi:MAG: amino acid adenylation domain-containing protein [Bacteroidia bacterium]|nr:amino acid adenylation domain-containing protein [Bacteroidia bacterium]